MNESSKFVGFDVHKATIAVAVADKAGGEPRFFRESADTPAAVAKLMMQLAQGGARLSVCYEAGCCGYVLHRQLTKLGHFRQVVAPSLIPKTAGDRVKTDRRDSLMLARLLRAGEPTEIWIPDGLQGACRVLPNCNALAVFIDCRGELGCGHRGHSMPIEGWKARGLAQRQVLGATISGDRECNDDDRVHVRQNASRVLVLSDCNELLRLGRWRHRQSDQNRDRHFIPGLTPATLPDIAWLA